MSDLIDRQAAITIPVTPKEDREYQTYNLDDAYERGWEDLEKRIEQLPSAQPVPKKGKWRHYEGYLTCSECGAEYYDDIMEYCGDDVPKFCPNCGADMRGERREENEK